MIKFILLLLATNLRADVSLTFAGDITLGTDASFSGKTFNWQWERTGQNPTYFTSGIDNLFRDDLTIANLEGVISDTPLTPVSDKKYRFIGQSQYLQILKTASIELVNLANNHAPYDFGDIGYESTKDNLDKAGIYHYGYKNIFTKEINGKKVCICGLEGFKPKVYKSLKSIAQLKSTCDILVYTFHWGVERQYIANEFQVNLAHYVIDNGADLVIGHHPHVVQNVEYYKGKPIVYSLGNFLFGGNNNPSDKIGAVYKIVFNDNGFTDKLIKISISSDPSRNNFQPIVIP
jgi:poly-gamma-glutamate synthesis protein (capsule biosynthesis protein)